MILGKWILLADTSYVVVVMIFTSRTQQWTIITGRETPGMNTEFWCRNIPLNVADDILTTWRRFLFYEMWRRVVGHELPIVSETPSLQCILTYQVPPKLHSIHARLRGVKRKLSLTISWNSSEDLSEFALSNWSKFHSKPTRLRVYNVIQTIHTSLRETALRNSICYTDLTVRLKKQVKKP